MFHKSFLKIYVSYCAAVASSSDADDNNSNQKKFTFNCAHKITDHFCLKKSLQNSLLNILLSQF